MKLKGIYIIKFDNGIKIGLSDNCYDRIKTYQAPWCRSIELAIAIECAYPRIVEQKVKIRFKDNIITGKTMEFITNIEFDIIKNYIESIRMSKGHYTFSNPSKFKFKKWIQLYPITIKPKIPVKKASYYKKVKFKISGQQKDADYIEWND